MRNSYNVSSLFHPLPPLQTLSPVAALSSPHVQLHQPLHRLLTRSMQYLRTRSSSASRNRLLIALRTSAPPTAPPALTAHVNTTLDSAQPRVLPAITADAQVTGHTPKAAMLRMPSVQPAGNKVTSQKCASLPRQSRQELQPHR